MPRVSVIICAHNPREDFLARTLAGLRRQTLPMNQWELLIIDNASNPPLAPRVDLTWHPHARVVVETELGLTPARLCGIQAAAGDLLVFVDDDNVLDPDYLKISGRIADECPEVGVFGGSQVPEYEVEPSVELSPYVCYLALRTAQREIRGKAKETPASMPYGAGLCLRRNLALRYVDQIGAHPLRRMLGRSGGTGLLSGEDFDMAFTVCEAGFEMLLTPELTLVHLIGKRRVEETYLLQLIEGCIASTIILAEIHDVAVWKAGRFVFLRGLARILMQRERFKRRLAVAILKGRMKGVRIVSRRTTDTAIL